MESTETIEMGWKLLSNSLIVFPRHDLQIHWKFVCVCKGSGGDSSSLAARQTSNQALGHLILITMNLIVVNVRCVYQLSNRHWSAPSKANKDHNDHLLFNYVG